MRVVHCMREPYTVYIGRPAKRIPASHWTILGNPFPLKGENERAGVISRFEEYARNNPSVLNAIIALSPDDILGCWCAPRPCHGDVIIKLWREIHGEAA